MLFFLLFKGHIKETVRCNIGGFRASHTPPQIWVSSCNRYRSLLLWDLGGKSLFYNPSAARRPSSFSSVKDQRSYSNRVADGLKVNQPGTTYPSFNITGGPENTHLKGMGLIRVTPKTHLQIITGIKTAALRFVQCLVSRFCAAQLDKWRWTSLKWTFAFDKHCPVSSTTPWIFCIFTTITFSCVHVGTNQDWGPTLGRVRGYRYKTCGWTWWWGSPDTLLALLARGCAWRNRAEHWGGTGCWNYGGPPTRPEHPACTQAQTKWHHSMGTLKFS